MTDNRKPYPVPIVGKITGNGITHNTNALAHLRICNRIAIVTGYAITLANDFGGIAFIAGAMYQQTVFSEIAGLIFP